MDKEKLTLMALMVGFTSGILSIWDRFVNRPPTPRCPTCRTALYNPATRYSKCPRCGQLLDWKVRARL